VFTVLHAELFTLTYKDKTGEAYEIKVSGEHPFWVADKGWVSARQLAINDRLEITDNTYVAVTGLTSVQAKLGETFTTYNFEVDDFHTYFVLQEGKTNGAFAVLVHNAIPCGYVGLDNNALVNAIEGNANVLRAMKGRAPIVSPTAVKEFLKGNAAQRALLGNSQARRVNKLKLKKFLIENGGRIGSKPISDTIVQAINGGAKRTNRNIKGKTLGDVGVISSSISDNVPLLSADKRLVNKFDFVELYE